MAFTFGLLPTILWTKPPVAGMISLSYNEIGIPATFALLCKPLLLSTKERRDKYSHSSSILGR
jgi:hypothetical protein